MGKECTYSFHDLFVAAHGRGPREDEYRQLMQTDHTKRNHMVITMAKQAGWRTEKRIGTDGLTYIAFYPPGA